MGWFCFVFFFPSKQKKILPEQLTTASPSPYSSPERDGGTIQILKDGVSLSGATAAVISTGKRQRKKHDIFSVKWHPFQASECAAKFLL